MNIPSLQLEIILLRPYESQFYPSIGTTTTVKNAGISEFSNNDHSGQDKPDTAEHGQDFYRAGDSEISSW